MATRTVFRSLILGAVLGATLVFSIGAPTRAGKRTVWEYKVHVVAEFNPNILDPANKLGEEGWELVLSYQDANRGKVFVFKREK